MDNSLKNDNTYKTIKVINNLCHKKQLETFNNKFIYFQNSPQFCWFFDTAVDKL